MRCARGACSSASCARSASAGLGALLVDPRGTGESALAFDETTLETHVADVRDGLHELARRFPEAHPRVLAVRYGAVPALLGAQPPAAAALLLIDPCLDVRAALRQDLRGELAKRMRRGGEASEGEGEDRDALVAQLDAGRPIVLDGERFPPALWRGLSAAQPAVLLAEWGERATVLRSGRETFVPFHRQLPQARVTVEEPAFEAAALAWARHEAPRVRRRCRRRRGDRLHRARAGRVGPLDDPDRTQRPAPALGARSAR